MYLLECGGRATECSENRFPFLIKEFSGKLQSSDQTFRDSIDLFKYSYRKSSALAGHSQHLFNVARKYFQFLNHASRNDSMPTYDEDLCNNGFLRERLVSFFLYIRELFTCDCVREEIFEDKCLLSTVKKNLYSFRTMLKTIGSLPNFIIHNCTSELGNQCTLASFHIFHLYLELFWLNFDIAVKILHLEPDEILLDTEAFNTEYFSIDKFSNFNKEIETEIEWILYNLISLASKSYMKEGNKKVFPCTCVKEIWISLLIYLEELTQQNKCANFWSYFNNIMKKYLLDVNDQTIKTLLFCNSLYKFDRIECNNCTEFSLQLLLKISQLSIDISSTNSINRVLKISPNFEFLEYIISKITNSETSLNEEQLREVMRDIIRLVIIWPEPRHEIITLLWEYFHKRLNSAFTIQGKDDLCSSSLISSNVADAVAYLESSLENLPKRETIKGNSFALFNTILGMYLKRSNLTNQPSLSQKIKGRILPKFTPNKVLALNEHGLEKFCTLYLMMALSTDLKDICSKLQGLLIQLPLNNLSFHKKQILIKSHLIILYLYSKNNISVAQIALPLKNIMNSYCDLRDSESMMLIKVALKGCLDIFEASTQYENDEYVLIDSWMVKYMTVCNISDIYEVFESFSTIITKLGILYSYQLAPQSSLSSMIDVFFTHILNCTKTLFSNGTPAIQLSNLAVGFLKFLLDNKSSNKKYDSFEVLLEYFIAAENINERVMRSFLVLILQDDQIIESLENENDNCQHLVIRFWCRYLIISHDNDNDQLMSLVCQLKEFAELNLPPICDDSDQKKICNFFFALKSTWSNIEDTNAKLLFRKRINSYLKNIDKIVFNAVKTASSLDIVLQILMLIATLFLHCSTLIYTRADPRCLLHGFINTILLPPQLFMEKKVHPYIAKGICKSWYLFMRGLFQLDYKNDTYIDKTMKDMIIQYTPLFTEKTCSNDGLYNVTYKIIPNECSEDMQLEQYILEKIAINFITCRGKQSHVHSTKALSIILHISGTTNVNLLYVIVSCTLLSVFEQLMFSDITHPNKKISRQIISTICAYSNEEIDKMDLKNEVREILIKTCQKHLAFNSGPFFKLVLNIMPMLGIFHMNVFLSTLKTEVSRVEKMRGIGFDHGLRNGIKEIESNLTNCK